MCNYNSSFKVRLTIDRICLLSIFILFLVISPLVDFDEARAALITFDDYPEGTTITDQYQDFGVIFLGEPQAPVIYDGHPLFGLEDPILGCSSTSSSIIVSFVDPVDGTLVEATDVWFTGYFYFQASSTPVTMTYYDINENVIGQEFLEPGAGQLPAFNFPSELYKFVLTPGTSTYAWMNDLNFQLLPPPPLLVDPGPSTECESTAGQPINLTTGDVWISKNDYSVPGLAGGLSITRTWNSLWNQSSPPFETGMFGRGWTSDFEERLQVFNSTHIIYWRGSGNTWIFEAPVGCTGCAYNLISPANQQASLQYDSATTLYTLSFINGTTKVFSNSGWLLEAIDRNGNQTTVLYDSSDRITTISAPGGQWISFTYGDSQYVNLATSTQDAAGTVATFSYDDSNLTQVVYADGSQINYTYDTADNIISVSDSKEKVLETHTYDTSGRGLSSSRADSVDLITIAYPSGSSTILTDSAGNTTTYLYSTISNKTYLTAVQGPGCNSCGGSSDLFFTLDGSGNRLSRTDANGNTTAYTYDSAGNIFTRTNADGTWTYTYNNFGEVLSAEDPQGNTTTYLYDDNGNLISVTEPSPDGGSTPGPETEFLYDSEGELIKVTDPLRNSTTITYSPAGLISTIKNAQRKVTSFSYDERGNRISITDALGQTTSFVYDAMNRLAEVVYPDNSTQRYAYDFRGRRIFATDANNIITSYSYDDADRLILVMDAANNQTIYSYDNESNLISITDGLNRTTRFDYDRFGRLIETTFPSTLFETYSYDNVGNLISKTDRNSQIIDYTYDQLNRMIQKRYATYTGTYTYDSVGRLTQASDPTGTYQFVYDNLGRLIQTITNYAFLTDKFFTISYGYDEASNRTSLTDPENGVTAYAYNALNLITSLTNPDRKKFKWSYDAIGRRTEFSRPNSVKTSYTYDSLSRLLSISHARRKNILDGAVYTMDAAGNRTSRTLLPSGTDTNYAYDDLYQLITAIQDSSTVENYTYDEVGNRLSSIEVSTCDYNSSNELTWKPDTVCTYDNNGNLLSKGDAGGTTSYAWDPENRLTGVTLSGSGEIVSFQYDPFGRRIYKSSLSGTTIFVYDGITVIEEVSADGSLAALYTHALGIDEPLTMLRDNTMSYYLADGLGSVTSLTDAKGNIASTYRYDSFGNLTASTGSISNPFRYTGRVLDAETGLYFYRARYYDPSIGRFLSEDPIRFGGGINFYRYVQNNPINLIDPLGLYCKIIWGEPYGGGDPLRQWETEYTIGYWETMSKWLLVEAILGKSKLPIPNVGKYEYTIRHTIWQLFKEFIDYWKVCYDDCTNEETSLTYIGRGETGKTQGQILKQWDEQRELL
jgi:RHS repeat-associated protein